MTFLLVNFIFFPIFFVFCENVCSFVRAFVIEFQSIEERKKRIEKLSAYGYIESLTPKITQELSQEVLALMTADKASQPTNANNSNNNEDSSNQTGINQQVTTISGFMVFGGGTIITAKTTKTITAPAIPPTIKTILG